MIDPREPVYRKLPNGRYKAFASMEDSWHRFDPWHSEGLWLHTRSDSTASQSLISSLEDLPCSAVAFASVMSKHRELTDLLRTHQSSSIFDTAAEILEWIAKNASTNQQP